jgi:hypothetical protein
MNKRIKSRWVKALKSGKYKQGKGQLKNYDDTYCCLGVLCDLYTKTKEGKKHKVSWDFDGNICGAGLDLPEDVRNWAELDEADPDLYGSNLCSDCNDKLHFSFDRIAGLIESNL